MTIAEAEKKHTSDLALLYDLEEAKALVLYAVEHICGLTRSEVFLKKSDVLSPMDETSLQMIVDELKTGKPIQYIIGEAEFFGLKFKVNPSVLIPRPETEELVDWVLTYLQDQPHRDAPVRILDIGTGSGCIPISLKKSFPGAEVWGVDLSSDAIETAIRNSVSNGTEVKFLQGDILTSDFGFSPCYFEVIVSNPPYITYKEKDEMHRNVLDFEPELALFVPNENPLLFYAAIADFAQDRLKHDGFLFFEINEHFGKETEAMLEEKGFVEVLVKKDLMGKNRMIKAKKNPKKN